MSPSSLKDVLERAASARKSGEAAAIVTVVEDRSGLGLPSGSRMFVPSEGEVDTGFDAALDAVLIEEARAALRGRRAGTRSYLQVDGKWQSAGIQGGALDVYFDLIERPPRLIIVGAGHIALPLCKIARILDFEVIVLDDRPEYASRERFPDASAICVGPYRETLASVAIHSDTYVVLVTRGHVHDEAGLEQVLHSDAAYVGMIGSKRRVRTVMETAHQRGFDLERLRRVHAPIGLDIGSQTPGEIAVAIMAEIINVRRGGHAPSLALGQRLRV